MKGRKPTPTNLKVLRGNPGKRALPKNEPEPPAKDRTPFVPRHLKGEARKAWRILAPVLHSTGLLTDADLHALELYCTWYATYRKAVKALDADGYVVTNSRGDLAPSPWIGLAHKASDHMRRIMIEFGMTPSARSRVQIATAEDADPLADYLAKKTVRIKHER